MQVGRQLTLVEWLPSDQVKLSITLFYHLHTKDLITYTQKFLQKGKKIKKDAITIISTSFHIISRGTDSFSSVH